MLFAKYIEWQVRLQSSQRSQQKKFELNNCSPEQVRLLHHGSHVQLPNGGLLVSC